EVTSHFTVSGAQLVLGGATRRSNRLAGQGNGHVEIAPDAFKQDEGPRHTGGRWLLAVYFWLSGGGLAFAFFQPNPTRAVLGMAHALGVFGLLLTGNWLLLV